MVYKKFTVYTVMLAQRPISTRLATCELTLCFPWDWISKAFWTWFSGNSRGIIAQCLPFSDDEQYQCLCLMVQMSDVNVRRHRWPCSLPKTTGQRWLHGNRLFSNTGSLLLEWRGACVDFPERSDANCLVSGEVCTDRCSDNSLWLQVQNKWAGLA